ncbi:hypothetical protein IAQ61_004166 [Plenodomus lingam]|nr:hypothetical protein IAQ61_004166 [Plenodomus lingam]
MVNSSFYVLAIIGLSLSFLLSTWALCHLLGIFPLLRELADNAKRRRAEKARPKPEGFELESFADVRRRARERKRAEETKRRERNKTRRETGFYEELGRAYRRS